MGKMGPELKERNDSKMNIFCGNFLGWHWSASSIYLIGLYMTVSTYLLIYFGIKNGHYSGVQIRLLSKMNGFILEYYPLNGSNYCLIVWECSNFNPNFVLIQISGVVVTPKSYQWKCQDGASLKMHHPIIYV